LNIVILLLVAKDTYKVCDYPRVSIKTNKLKRAQNLQREVWKRIWDLWKH